MTHPPTKLDQTEIDDVIANYDGEALVKEMQQNLANLIQMLGTAVTNLGVLVTTMEAIQEQKDPPQKTP